MLKFWSFSPVMAFFFLGSPLEASEWYHRRFQSSSGVSVSLDYQLMQEGTSGSMYNYWELNNGWINVHNVPAGKDVRVIFCADNQEEHCSRIRLSHMELTHYSAEIRDRPWIGRTQDIIGYVWQPEVQTLVVMIDHVPLVFTQGHSFTMLPENIGRHP